MKMVPRQSEQKFGRCSRPLNTAPRFPRLLAAPAKTLVRAACRQVAYIPANVAANRLPLIPYPARETPDGQLGGSFPLNHHLYDSGGSLYMGVPRKRLVP